MQAKGPFFEKDYTNGKPEYKLAKFCKECAFGDADLCLLNPCIYFQFDDEENEEQTNE